MRTPFRLSAIGSGKMAMFCGIHGESEEARYVFEKAAALSLRESLKAFWQGSCVGAFLAAIKRSFRFLCSWG